MKNNFSKKALSVILTLIMILSAFPITAVEGFALDSSGSCGTNVTYTFDSSTGVLTISGNDYMDNYYSYNSSPFYNKTEITSVIIESGVTSIGRNAFRGCTSLADITIPSSVIYIYDYAFSGCTSLADITIPSSVKYIYDYAFSGCTSLANITISNSVTSIGDYAFSGCTSLTSITIGNGVTSIGRNAFRGCTSLADITIPGSVKYIYDYAFSGCTSLTSITIGNGVTSIGDWAFYNCTSLTSIIIPSSVTSIGYGAFRGCTSLKGFIVNSNNYGFSSVNGVLFNHSLSSLICYPADRTEATYVIPNSVTSIDSYAFFGSTSLETVTIPNSVTSIGDYAFSDSTSLETVTIPDSVTSIGYGPFSGCTSLTSITIPGSVKEIVDYAFEGCTSLTSITIPDSVTSIGKSAFSGCTSLESITIPNSVTSLGWYAFYGCTSLASVTIPDSVTSIGNEAFRGCTSMTSVIIPASVTSIGNDVFEDCISLTSVTIPDSVTSIGSDAFSNCTSLTNITIPESVTNIGSDAFDGCTSIEEFVVYYNPNCSYSSVKTAITEVIIPDGVTSIGSWKFSGCTSLKSVTIPDSVTSIGERAFYECTSLTSFTIPAGVASIGNYAFLGCTAIEEFVVDSDNDYYSSLNGVLFSKNMSDLISYPAGKTDKSYIIPDSVTNINNSAFYGCTELEELIVNYNPYCSYSNVKTAITEVIIPDSVTSIGKDAFSGFTSLTSITIPDSVTSIGNGAFSGCTSLTSITIPSSVKEIYDYAFESCTSLTSITIPDSVTSIGDYAFIWCESLTNITIGNGVTSIGSEAFYNTAYYENASNWEDGVLYIGTNLIKANNDLSDNYTVKDSTTVIADEAFVQSVSLREVTIPDSVVFIGEDAFINPNMSEEEHLQTIYGYTGSVAEKYAMINKIDFVSLGITQNTLTGFVYEVVDETCCTITGCKGAPVGNIVIPETIDGFTVTGLGERAFYGATLLEGITIPDSVINIEEGAFFSCNSLQSVTVGANNPIYYVDDGVLYVREVIGEENGQYIYSDNLTLVLYPSAKTGEEFTIPANVVSIYSDAFGICKNLKHLIIPETITNIDWLSNAEIDDITLHFNFSAEYANYNFNNRGKITEIIIPDGTVTIDTNNISCYRLKRIIIPESVKNINFAAFSITSVEEGIYIPKSVENIEPGAFAVMFGDIIVDSENPYYSSENGVLFNKAKTVLIAVPPFKSNNTPQYSLQQLFEISEYLDVIKETITINEGYEIPNSVIHIADYAFAFNLAKNIEIPYSVVSIGKWAFADSNLESVTIPDSVESIGEYAFNCNNLKRVFIPDSVTSIGENALVSEVIFGYTGTCAETYANENNITFIALYNLIKGDVNYDGVVDIADYAILKTALKEVNFSEAEIPAEEMYLVDFNNDNAFDAFDMYYLDRVINDLDADSFDYEIISGNEIKITGYEGTQTKLTIPSTIDGYTVTQIGANAFDGNTRLKRIVIPKTVTQIGNYAFKGCSSLESVSLPNGLTNIRYGSFLNCSKLYVLRIPDTVTSVGSFAFKGCSSLKGVTVSDSMTAIGNGVFSNCSELEEIYIPRSVTSINSNAFEGHTRDLIVYGFVDSYAYTFVNNSTDEHLGFGTIVWVCDGDNCEACKKSHDENGMSYPCAEGGVHVAPKEVWKCKGNCPVCQQHQDNNGNIIECTDHSWMESYIRYEFSWLSDDEVAQQVAAMENRCTCGLVTETYPDCTCHYQLPPSNYITIPVSN